MLMHRQQRRREQNRKSQRTFRQRQARYIQELEERLKQQTDKYERLKRAVDEINRQQPGLVESVLAPEENFLSPPLEETDDTI